MISINKTEQIPSELIRIQDEIADQLFLKKDKFKWESSHYSVPIKQELKSIYNNKCAFCEVLLTEDSTDNKFTVEHFRPKEYYYWLGNEWTNLFPTCKGCNQNKGNDFPLMSHYYKIKEYTAPFDENNKLIRERCKANAPELLREQPLFIHPEIIQPEKYFSFEISGKAIVNETVQLDKYELQQAGKMIDKFLNRYSIQEQRKRKIQYFQNRLTNVIRGFLKICGEDYSEKDIRLGFNDFFSSLLEEQQPNAEFSLLGYYMVRDFDKFFLDKIENDSNVDIRMLVNFAYNQAISSIV